MLMPAERGRALALFFCRNLKLRLVEDGVDMVKSKVISRSKTAGVDDEAARVVELDVERDDLEPHDEASTQRIKFHRLVATSPTGSLPEANVSEPSDGSSQHLAAISAQLITIMIEVACLLSMAHRPPGRQWWTDSYSRNWVAQAALPSRCSAPAAGVE